MPFKKESVLKWFSFQSEVVVDQTFEITRAEAELQDLYLDFDSLTAYEVQTLYDIKQGQSRIVGLASEGSWSPMMFSFQMSLSKQILKRSHYSMLDFLSDIGGMQGLLLVSFGFLNAILNSQNSEELLIAKLFKFREENEEQLEDKKERDDRETSGFTKLRLYGLICFKWCRRQNMRERMAMKRAKQDLNKEADLVELLRFMRVLRKYLRLKSPDEYDELSQKAKFNVIELTSDEEKEYTNLKLVDDEK